MTKVNLNQLKCLPSFLKLGGAAIGVLGAIALFGCGPFQKVESGYEGVLMNFGAVQKITLEPGKLHFIIPFYQSMHPVSTQPQTAITHESAATHDLQDVATSVALTYHIAPIDVPYFYSEFRNAKTLTERVIAPAISNDVKAVTAHYNAEELVTKRDEVDQQIKNLITQSLQPYHITIETINTSNFRFSEAYSRAIENKQVQEQEALKAEYVLHKAKIQEQEKVVRAAAEAEANVAEAKGRSEARMLMAESEAKANALVSASLTPSLLQEKAIERWSGDMPTYLSSGAPLPFIGGAAGPVPVNH